MGNRSTDMSSGVFQVGMTLPQGFTPGLEKNLTMKSDHRLCLKSSTVQHLIHTGLEPGDRRRDENSRNRFNGLSSFRDHQALSTGQLRTAETEKPLKRFLDQSLGLDHRAEARCE